MRRVQVPLAGRSYSIKIASGLLASLGMECAKLGLGRRCAVITDSNVGPRFTPQVLDSLRKHGFEAALITVKAGESAKRLENVGSCYDALAGHRLERSSFIVALGGGVVGDLAGFVAATYLRGIAFVQVPTTLLAQVDSSVGGKVGVNIKAGKNLAGAFYQPKLVLCDLDTFKTLPDREFRAGLAEVIKYGIIRDPALFKRLERNLDLILKRDAAELGWIVARCCAIKAAVVSEDETETGARAILNFGHTIGHGLEAISGYGRYLHGEAISIGQVAAAILSQQLTGLPAADVVRIRELFHRAGLPISVKMNDNSFKRLMGAMLLDKKVQSGELKFVLARKIGDVVWGQRTPTSLIRTTLGLN